MRMRRGAIILCGGRSARMGSDKSKLPFGPGEVMLQRVVRLIGEVVPAEQIVCVSAPAQHLPELSAAVQIVRDHRPHEGPLVGLINGLTALHRSADAAFVTACDMPLLIPAFISRMFELLGDHEIAAPREGQRWHPLAAVYRTLLLPRAESSLAAGHRSLVGLLESSDCVAVKAEDLREIDPQLQSLTACNTRDEYLCALEQFPKCGAVDPPG